MLGRIISMGENGPVRNIDLRFESGRVASPLSMSRGEVVAGEVTGFELVATSLSPFLWGGCLGSLVMMAVVWNAPSVPAIAGLMMVAGGTLGLLKNRVRVLYTLNLLTDHPQRPKILFYRTLCQLDLMLVLDAVTWALGDRPRQCMGSGWKPQALQEVSPNDKA